LLFALAGQALGSATISGTVKPAANGDLTDAVVAATSDKFAVVRARVDSAAGTYTATVPAGTYTLAVVARNQAAPAVENVVLKDGDTYEQDFTLKTASPFPVVKSPSPIPLTDGIDSASFQDAPEINLNSGANDPGADYPDAPRWGGPNTLSGRFKVKYSSEAIHIAGDVTFKIPRVNNHRNGDIYQGNALEVDIQSDPYGGTRTAYDKDHNWQLVLSLGAHPDWWLYGGIQARPAINGKHEAVTSHVMIQDKTPNTGETFRVDIPWAILLDSSGKPIAAPDDNALGALDLALDASDPTADRSSATRAFQLTWSRFDDTYKNPSSEVPVQFVPQAPAATAGPN